MDNKFFNDKEYIDWLRELKEKVRNVQIKAAIKVNTEMITFYWELGADISRRLEKSKWGDGVIKQLSKDLIEEFPEMKGFSERNIKYIRQWYSFYNKESSIGQQAVAQLEKIDSAYTLRQITQIPWGHNLVIISKCDNSTQALFYIQKTIENNWSRAMLTHQIESGLYERDGKSVNNFDSTLPKPQSDLAKQTLKDPYILDIMLIREKHRELEIEDCLVNNLSKFLLELGAGFSYIGRQYKLEIAGDEYFIDLLFYHVRLHCYVVIELKTVKFKPEFAGKLNFYISAVDSILKTDYDNPTVGILICKSKNDTVVEYSLKDIRKPIGVSQYEISKILPENFKSALPSIEEIEAELEMIEKKQNLML